MAFKFSPLTNRRSRVLEVGIVVLVMTTAIFCTTADAYKLLRKRRADVAAAASHDNRRNADAAKKVTDKMGDQLEGVRIRRFFNSCEKLVWTEPTSREDSEANVRLKFSPEMEVSVVRCGKTAGEEDASVRNHDIYRMTDKIKVLSVDGDSRPGGSENGLFLSFFNFDGNHTVFKSYNSQISQLS